MFAANVRAEGTKLRSVRSTTWTLLATVGIAVGFGALVGVSPMSSWDNLDPEEKLRFDPTFFSLLGLGLGTILRRTAGAVAALVGLLVLAPLVSGFLPASFQESIGKCFPAQAGMAVFSVAPDPRSLTPWTGYGVLLAYVAITLIAGVALLTRRDA